MGRGSGKNYKYKGGFGDGDGECAGSIGPVSAMPKESSDTTGTAKASSPAGGGRGRASKMYAEKRGKRRSRMLPVDRRR